MKGARAVSLVLAVGLAGAACAAPALAARAKEPWPPAPKRGLFFAHFGEEHLDDDDGIRIFPRVIHDSARYKPDLVTTSGDKASDNSVENLSGWKEQMSFYDRKGIPYFAAVGNHDRSQSGTQGLGSSANGGDIAPYLEIFADRPYPFGDGPAVSEEGFEPVPRPATDPPGASTHYAVEAGAARFIFLDNSCFSFINCDPYQSPPLPTAAGDPTQYDFMRTQAKLASRENDLAFVVMHIPTQDPRPGHSQPTAGAHTLGEGTSPENATFEDAAFTAGVDGVFAGHIKGQWTYAEKNVGYFIDGGAGGEVYVGPGEETGVDSGYWHGYRLVSVRGNRIRTTDTVPVFSDEGIVIEGPAELESGTTAEFSAIGKQPTEEGPEVELELRDPSEEAPNFANLPRPARIWTTSDPSVLAPLAAEKDDFRREERTQTITGMFRARCPGVARVTITSGWERRRTEVRVSSSASTPAGC
ncbi:MAG: metallophosphoesterase family protein [Solirubrobacterales bacterium]